MIYYPMVYGYASSFDSSKLFRTEDEARAYDRARAAEVLGAMSAPEFQAAFLTHVPEAAKTLRYAADELPPAPFSPIDP